MIDAKFAVGDHVHFFDDPEVGVVQKVMSHPEGHFYLVKFGETVDQNWPGFEYPERYLRPEIRPESTS